MSRGSELGLWLLAGTVSVAVHVGGVSAAFLLVEQTRIEKPPQARLEVISLPTTVPEPVTSLARAEQTKALRLAPSTLQAVKPEATAPATASKVTSAPLASLESAKPDVASAAVPQGLEPAEAKALAALDGTDRDVASAAMPEELKPALADAAPMAAPHAASPEQPLPSRTTASAPSEVAAVSDEPVLAPDVKGKSVDPVAAPASVAKIEPRSVEKQVSVQLAPVASAPAEAVAAAGAEAVKPAAPLVSAATRIAPTANVPVAAAPAPDVKAKAVDPVAAPASVAKIEARSVEKQVPAQLAPAASALAEAAAAIRAEVVQPTAPLASAATRIAPTVNVPVAAAPAPAVQAAPPAAAAIADPASAPSASIQPDGGAVAEQDAGKGSGEDEVALLVPAPPSAPEPAEVDPYASALRFLEQRDTGWCLLVMPASAKGGLLGLEGFTDHKAALDNFLQAFRSETRIDAATRSGTVTPAQCRVLNFARNLARYPAFSLRFELDSRVVGSGDVLSGAIQNAGEAPVHLLLVDDEGKVQNLDQFLGRNGAEISFRAPVTLTSGPVATDQLLLALAGPSALKTITDLDGDNADQFFSKLTEELAAKNVSPDIAIASFTVK